MSVTPTALPSITSSASWHTSYEYRYRYSTSTHAYYGLWDIAAGDWLRSLSAANTDRIKVGIETSASDYNTWTDAGTFDPTSVTENSGTIKLENASSQLLYEFTKPTTASWISSGGGTSTEDVLVEDARIVDYGGITGFRFEQRGYAAASYQLIGPATYSWTVSVASNNLQHHISQLAAGTYVLSSGGSDLATLSTPSRQKKVFCNFW